MDYFNLVNLVNRRATTNPKKAWSELKNLWGEKDTNCVYTIRTDDGPIRDEYRVACEFGSFFSSITCGEDDTIDVEHDVVYDNCSIKQVDKKLSFQEIEEDEVLQLLSHFDVAKAVGIDEISARILSLVAPSISSSLASLFNYSIATNSWPREWKSAVIIPVPKSGSLELVENFCPVSILPIVSKVFERLISRQIVNYLKANEIILPCQFCFRRNHTVQDALVTMIEHWRQALDNAMMVGSVMVHISKAFDKVNHPLLLSKMRGYGFDEKALAWFQGYLSGRRQRVKIGDHHSSWCEVRHGVTQGSILGPILFSLYVNDLPLNLSGSSIMQYADDTNLDSY